MRIGNINDIHKSQEADNLAGLIQSDSQKNMTKAERRKNWWHYYKWYVVCGIIMLLIVCNIVSTSLGLFDKSPDFQVAYIGTFELPADTVSALEKAFTSIADDFNGDGEIIVKINQYTTASEEPLSDVGYAAYTSEVALIGDIETCESYFFLMENPESIQKQYQILAAPDGSCPDENDDSVTDKVILWSDSPILPTVELGAYSVDILGQTATGDNQELLSNLFIGRRCFYNENITDNAEECSNLWNVIVYGSAPLSAESEAKTAEAVLLGSHLKVQNTNSQLTLLNNLDTLSADGLYYASWAAGSAQPYENSDGDMVDLYDAALYLLSGEYKDAQSAQENCGAWLASARKNYDVLSEEEITCSGQTYTLLTYHCVNADNPYARGVSAFGVYENCAVCIELTCLEEFEEDLEEILINFLTDCAYS
ncbi:MAG: hypothetical protein NC231_01175 [Bacillus sp. (in: Bacteria)]|nr:hypothetical protein [Bacillus sp. (in: firmicutes)]MCM1426407.1 hypothetical protein [Eubacterium sp.]